VSAARPLVSVVVPVYDLEAYLGEALDSVLAQTMGDLEVIAVDDGSRDGSREIIAEYRRRDPERIRAILAGHGGAGAARNRGIAAARGGWVAFLDGDDVWRPAKLAEQLREAGRDPECSLVASEAEDYATGRRLREIPDPIGDLALELLVRGCFLTLSTVLVRREIVAAVGFDERLEGAQDLDLFLRLADGVRVRVVRRPLVRYRVRDDSISGLGSTHFLQVHRHLQVARCELERQRRERPEVIGPRLGEIRAKLRELSHEAAYWALMSDRAGVAQRLRLAVLALASDPLRAKNVRLIAQSVLPARVNRWLSESRRRGAGTVRGA